MGQSSPVEAAKWFVVQPSVEGFAVPPDAVSTVSGQSETGGVFLSTEGVLLEAFQSPVNQTWSIAPRGVWRRSNASFAGSKSWQGGAAIDQSTDRRVPYCGYRSGLRFGPVPKTN